MLPYNTVSTKRNLMKKKARRDKNGDLYQTYSSYERGIDLMKTAAKRSLHDWVIDIQYFVLLSCCTTWL
jgi:hypothetical protein